MDYDQARELMQTRNDQLGERQVERAEIIASHEGDRLFQYMRPFYPENLRWLGRTAATLAGTIKDIITVYPTVYKHNKNQREV